MQLVLPLLCNDAASYVLSAWSMVSCGHIQEQLVMLFFYNNAASYELSVWRVSSCGHVQEQLVMLPSTTTQPAMCAAATRQRGTSCSSIAACAHCHTSHDGLSARAHTRWSSWRSSPRCPATMQPAICAVCMARGAMRAVQEQLVMLLCKVTASHACRCGSTTKEHGAVGAACGLPACAYIRESGGAAALLLLYDDAASYVPPVCMACGVMRAVQSSL